MKNLIILIFVTSFMMSCKEKNKYKECPNLESNIEYWENRYNEAYAEMYAKDENGHYILTTEDDPERVQQLNIEIDEINANLNLNRKEFNKIGCVVYNNYGKITFDYKW